MARSRGARGRGSDYGEFWPGYVDVLSTLLLTVTFLMSIFMLAQFFVSQESSGKDTALRRLTGQIAQLTSLLSLEKGKQRTLEEELASLQASLASLKSENSRLVGLGSGADEKAAAAAAKIAGLGKDLDEQKAISNEALAKVDLLNVQLARLRQQIAALNEAIGAAEAKEKDAQGKIDDLGRRLNIALARQVQELQRYRSDFFGRLRELLKERKDIRIVEDRFVFESEVLFPRGQAQLSPEGLAAMSQMAGAIKDLEGTIPAGINWVLQVEGHTDKRPIASAQFPSNWELSTSRAISVVRFFIQQGIAPDRLVAAGYGEFRPIGDGDSEEAMRLNRRIELKLTNR